MANDARIRWINFDTVLGAGLTDADLSVTIAAMASRGAVASDQHVALTTEAERA